MFAFFVGLQQVGNIDASVRVQGGLVAHAYSSGTAGIRKVAHALSIWNLIRWSEYRSWGGPVQPLTC